MKRVILWLSTFILLALYSLSFLAPFIAPYPPNKQFREYTLSPPTKIHFFEERNGRKVLTHPYVYRYVLKNPLRRVYEEDKTQKFRVKFFYNGKIFGVEGEGKIFLLGCDDLGRDIFSRILYGGRISLTIGIVGVLISFSIGLLIGGIAGYFGGTIDVIIMRLAELLMAIPTFFLLLALSVVIPPGIPSSITFLLIVTILSFIGWASFARVIRGIILGLRESDFVVASKAFGSSYLWVIRKHLIPQTLSYSIVAMTLSIPSYILAESALSLLGVGIKEPDASWGNMLARALNIALLSKHPYLIVPGILIFVTVLSYNFVGDHLRDVLEPKGD